MGIVKFIPTYFKNVKSELKKVRWAERKEVRSDMIFTTMLMVLLLGYFIGMDAVIMYVKTLF